MNAEDISKCLQGTGNLHLVTMNRKGKVLEGLREIQRIIGNGQLNKLLTMQNKYGTTMLHYLMCYSEDPKDVTAVLEYVEGVMEGELFKQFLTQKANKGIFPISCAKLHIMKDILVFMGRYFSIKDIRDMLMENKVRLGKSIRKTDCALEEILYLEEFLGSESFKEILISKDKDGRTRLHYLMEDQEEADKLFVSDLKVYDSFLDSDSLKAFLFSQNKYDGHTVLHNWARYYRGSQDLDIDILQHIGIFHALHSFLSPDAFEYLLNIRSKNGYTFIHFYEGPISELSFLDEFLGKEKLIKLVTAKSNDNGTRLHCIWTLDDIILIKDIKFYSELLDESFRDFILTKDEDGKTFCYYLISDDNLSDLNKLEGILSPDLFLELQKTVKLESESDSEPESKRSKKV